MLCSLVVLLLAALAGTAGPSAAATPPPAAGLDGERFGRYWYQGKAELTRYALEQARYGELHKGDAVLIFVTEPFLPDKQVKLERGDPSRGVTVLKLNSTRKFFTGIYPYSLMTSTFSPVDFSRAGTLKVTSSTQEWCGQTFAQLNRRGGRFHASLRSYFEAEGDRETDFAAAWLEDEVWTRIRLAPETLAVGEVRMVPGLHYARLGHREVRPERARVSLQRDGGMSAYTIDYPELARRLVIRFENAFPFKIVGFEETTPAGRDGKRSLTTKAVATNSLLLDYWRRNGNADAHYRKELGLTMW